MAYTTINKSSDYFNTKLYTGNGSTQSITGVGFQPDLTWIKSRNMNYDQNLFDVIRGTTKRLQANFASAETTVANSVTAFGTDGFTVGSDAGVNGAHTFASWNWLGANGTAANTDGSISSTVSANTTSGFSIVSFTAPASGNFTVGHGLSSPPEMIIIKNRDTSQVWYVLHKDLSSFTDRYLNLNATNAESTYSMMSQTPSNSLLYLKVGATADANNNHIIYCFNSVQGYSKFGSYIGNGSTDGTFVYTGFSPAFVIVKQTDGANQWNMWDSKRDTFNVSNKQLYSNLSNAESVDAQIDMLSNGFKLRSATTQNINVSGTNHIYMAFAEAPLVGSNNVPATAR